MEIDPVLQAAIGGVILFVVQILKKLKFLQSSQWYALSAVVSGAAIALGYGALYSPGYAELDAGMGVRLVLQGGILGIMATGLYSAVKNTLGK